MSLVIGLAFKAKTLVPRECDKDDDDVERSLGSGEVALLLPAEDPPALPESKSSLD